MKTERKQNNHSEKISYYAAAILLWAKREEKDYFTKNDVEYWLNNNAFKKYSPNDKYIEDAMNLMQVLEVAKIIKDDFGPTVVELEGSTEGKFIDSSNAINYLSDIFSDSPFYKANRYGLEWILAAIDEIDKSPNQAPSIDVDSEQLSNDEWQPLPIDREDEHFVEALEAIEEAIEAIEGDNGYAATEPEERNGILYSAKGTLQALKEGTPSREQLISSLLKPFNYIAKKFGDGIIGVAAKKAADLIFSFLEAI